MYDAILQDAKFCDVCLTSIHLVRNGEEQLCEGQEFLGMVGAQVPFV